MIYRGLSSWMKFIELVSERKRENNRDACSIPIVIPIGEGELAARQHVNYIHFGDHCHLSSRF